MLRAGGPTAGLSVRERTVAAKFAQGMTYREIGETRQAASAASRLAREFPSFTTTAFIRSFPVTNPVAVKAIRDGARRAGLA